MQIQYHQAPAGITYNSSAKWIISLFTTHLRSHAQHTLSTFFNVFVCFCCFWFLSVWRGCRWDWRWRGIVETEKDGAARGRSPPLMRTTTFPLWEQPPSHFENNHIPTLTTTTFPLWEQPPSHFEDNHLSNLRTSTFPLWEQPYSYFRKNHPQRDLF